jgi:folate-binding protein YgfZ
MTHPALSSDFSPQFDTASLPPAYGDPRAEYEAIRHGAALIDLSPIGKLRLKGKNAIQFLNGLVSNDVKTLEPGAGVFACFPNLQGKVAALTIIYNTGANPSDGLLFELDASNRAKIFKNLARFVAAGEFFLTDVTEELALFSLQGPQAAQVLSAATNSPIEYSDARTIRAFPIAAVHIATHNRTGSTGFDLYVDKAQAVALWQTLIAHGAQPVGQAALNVARLEAGIPREPADINENYIINETNLTEAVSYTKGCYLGQEVIARIHWRGQPAKQLKSLLIDAPSAPAAGTELWATDAQGTARKVGEITSSAYSFELDRLIAFGYVHRYFLIAGQAFTLKQGETKIGKAVLAETPLVKHS